MVKEKSDNIINKIFKPNGKGSQYEWDGYEITSTEFVDHVGDVIKEIKNKIEECKVETELTPQDGYYEVITIEDLYDILGI